jgi:mannose-6-phosphate isomerase-like protein (cupin superfamily)
MSSAVIQFPMSIKPFKEHSQLKHQIIDAISRQHQAEHMLALDSDIIRCDWGTSRYDGNREWLKIINGPLAVHLNDWCTTMGYQTFGITEIWFQQYATGGKHAWHTHSNNFTNVYYVHLPEDGAQTEWIDPVTKDIHTFDVHEGDIITFPSWVIHRAPINTAKQIKTIISWNMEVSVKDRDAAEIYG